MRIGFIGLGNIGGPAALHIVEAGHQVTVHDLVRQAAAAFTSLPFPEDVESVVLGPKGIVEGIPHGAVYGDLTTNRVSLTRKLYAVLKEKGVEMLDMPITGGHVGSVAATMVLFVGGDEPVYRRLKPVIKLMGRPVYCGPNGSGNVCKLVNNLIGHGFEAVVHEAFTIGVKAGVPVKTLIDAISMGGLGKPYVPALRFTGDYGGGSRLDLAAASVLLACELGRELHVPAEVSAVIEQRYVEALAKGLGNLGPGAVQMVYESRSGVALRGP